MTGPNPELPKDQSRRVFLQTLAVSGAGTCLPISAEAAAPQTVSHAPDVITTPSLELRIGQGLVQFNGKNRLATVVNGQLPAPILRWKEGDTVRIRVHNDLDEDTSIHWHGILLPAAMDGVPGFSFHGIKPGEFYDYQFTLKQSGTYWYHAHSSLQEAKGVYGAIVIDPKTGPLDEFERDHVIVLSDWSDEDPHRIFRKLKKQADYYNHAQLTVADFARDVREKGLAATVADRKAWGKMRMSPTDLADVNGHTYAFLINGHTPKQNHTLAFAANERVRLRFINAAAMSFFDVRILGLKMTVVAADGQPVEPVSVDEFRIGVAETYDVIVAPDASRAYTIFAQNLDRTGFARATLSPRPDETAPVPVLDKRVTLSMADMGHGGMQGGCGASMQGNCGASMQGNCGASMQGNCGASMKMDHGKHGGDLQHPANETNNPGIDMQTMSPTRALNDPGIGLRDEQLAKVRSDWNIEHRVLTYANLRSRFDDPDPREPSRTIELHLTGHMERYTWSFNGEPFSKAEPLRLHYGERVRIKLVNDTMMEHPIHLHGLWSDLEDEDGKFLVRKHTVNVPPGTIRSYRVSADALGRWAYHCHLLMHMEAGMFREVVVE